MQKEQLILDGLLVFSGPGSHLVKTRIAKIDDGYLQLEILESELQSRKVGTSIKVPIAYVLDCGFFKMDDAKV